MAEINPLILQTPTNNPYREAARLIYQRLKWDLTPASWHSRAALRQIKDSHGGKKAVILCNGPSLNKVNFEMLEGVYTFGLNKINLLFSRTDFRPSSIVAVNPLVLEQNINFYRDTEIPLFVDSNFSPNLGVRKNLTYINNTWSRKFSRDCSLSVYQGFTVTFVAIQLAFHMGFTKVALVGADHKFHVAGPANTTVTSGPVDESHFDPNYFAGGVKWDLPDLFESEVSYTMARNVFEAFDRKIFNATEGGALEVFDRISLEKFVSL